MQRIGLIRLGRKNLPVDLLGSLQATSLMLPNGHRQRFGNRCHNTL
jgi:hypothetical protein